MKWGFGALTSVVLLGGCDKTIPSLLMAACSVDLPAIVVPGGPMLTGTFRGVPLACGTDVWRLSEEVRAGTLSNADLKGRAVGVQLESGETIRAALKFVPPERLSVAPDCGLSQTARWAARRKLANMVEGARRVRQV